jgi:hypothetical protein
MVNSRRLVCVSLPPMSAAAWDLAALPALQQACLLACLCQVLQLRVVVALLQVPAAAVLGPWHRWLLLALVVPAAAAGRQGPDR